jgi:hypothetical protein
MTLAANDAGSATVLPAWTKYVDWWEVATGIFVITVFLSSHYFTDLRGYAGQFVKMTIICELCMIWAAIGAAATSGARNSVQLIGGIVFALGLYFFSVLAIVWKAREFYIIPQALWILGGRFRPRGGAAWFGDDNLRRFLFVSMAGWLAVLAQLLLLVIVTIVLATLFNISEDYGGGASGVPRWVSALIWSAFYIELAFLLPKAEAFAGRSKTGKKRVGPPVTAADEKSR